MSVLKNKVPHKPFTMDNNGVIEYQNNITYLMTSYFPNTTVFPLLGNHDTHPSFQVLNISSSLDNLQDV